jgi:hypothetical protein
MRRLIKEESGVTIVELVAVIGLAGIVMGATLGSFTQFERTTLTNQRQSDAQDQVRRGVTGLARELRNLASPTNELPQAIDRSEPDDVVFQSVTNNTTRRVRYCLDTANRRLWRQLQIAPLAAMPGQTCPHVGDGWSTATVAAENIVNGARPVFQYNSTTLTAITEISASLWVDVNPGTPPLETSLQTSVFLRNQNRGPAAEFTAVPNGGTIVLNGSASEDPEGKALQFYWYDTAVSTTCTDLPVEVPQTGCVGVGIVFNYTPSAPGTRNVYLVVRDPAGLTATASTQSVCVSGGAQTCQ